MATRITGLATGLDVDSIVKTTMKAYQTKIDQQIQKKDVLEIKQKQARELVKKANDFFNKYLDRSSKDSLLNSINYASVKFSAGDSKEVTVTGLAGAKVDNYDIKVSQMARAASDTISNDELKKTDKITLKTGTKVITVDISGIDKKSENFSFEVVKAIKEELANNKITDFEVSHSDFAKGIVISTKTSGEDQSFSLKLDGEFSGTSIKLDDFAKTLKDGKYHIKIGDRDIAVNATDDRGNIISADKIAEKINEAVKDSGVNVQFDMQSAIFKVSSTSDTNIKLNANGQELEYKVSVSNKSIERSTQGQNCIATIVNSKGQSYQYNGTSNDVTLDNVQFKFNNVTDSPVKVTGTNDGTEFKDKIVKFIDEYNNLITDLNKATMTKHNRNYSPLTAEQKKEMSENEIKLWNEKVEEGQLYRDSDLIRIADALKTTMSTVMSESGLSLESIGIKPVKDYAGTRNGTFTIADENVLKEAIEKNPEGVMDLFIKGSNINTFAGDDKTGVLNQLYYTINNEMIKSNSSLAKRIGFENTSTFTNNTMTLEITNFETKISDMQKSYTTKEQALYAKYATLESAMNKYNSQLSYLTSQFSS